MSKEHNIVVYNIHNKKFYKKEVIDYLKKFLLEYAKALSKELSIPMIDYTFIQEDEKYFFVSECYDDKVPQYELITAPFESNNLLDEIKKMKHFCLDFSNGTEVYNEFLKQILMSYLIGDVDRTEENIRLYKKGNLLHIAPYFDIDLIFSGYADSAIFDDLFYLYPEDLEQEIQRINDASDGSFIFDVESNNKYFDRLLLRDEKYIFSECIYDDIDEGHSLNWNMILNLIYQELDDKSIFEKIVNIDFAYLDKKYKLNFSKNANTIISMLFEKRKNKIQQLTKNNQVKKGTINYDFSSLEFKYSNYRNSIIIGDKKIHYKNADLFECQLTHLLSVFLNEIGIESTYYDYDDISKVSYCESMIKNDEKLLEFPLDAEDYYYVEYYFVLKEFFEQNADKENLLKLYKGYFAAAMFRDTDKNIGFIYDKKGNIKLTPYYDFGTPLLIEEGINGDRIWDIYIDELEKIEYCQRENQNEKSVQVEFENIFNKYIIKFKAILDDYFEPKLFENCITNIDPKIIENFINFDIRLVVENDHHTYSENSKLVITKLFEVLRDDFIKRYKNLKSSLVNESKKNQERLMPNLTK